MTIIILMNMINRIYEKQFDTNSIITSLSIVI